MDYEIYQNNHAKYIHITQHSIKAKQIIRDIIQDYSISTYRDHLLDLIHLILKHQRTCSVSECQAEHGLSDLILSESNKDRPMSCSLVICFIDLLKSSSPPPNATLNQLFAVTRELWWHEKVYMCRKSMELSYRMIPYIENDEPIITNVIRYIEDVSHCFKQQDLDRFQSIEYTEFFYTPTINTMTFDRETIKRLIQIIMALFLKHTTHFPPGLEALANTISMLYHTYQASIHPIELLFNMCCANDDDTTQLLDTVLTVYQQDMYCMTLLQHIQVNPHSLFLFFLQQCGSTHDILIDSLLNDSDFLAYFYRYVVYAHQDIHQFYAALVVLDMVNPFRWILRDTVRVLQGDGFPYNTKPLIRRLCMLQEQLLSLLS